MNAVRVALKPCPFCGGGPVVQHWHGGKKTKRMVACTHYEQCDVLPSVTGETREEAVERWNRRAG